ncbi:ABC transporter permease [Rhizobium sp. C1]|uniref:ABC transporter permease n=1 Tax=Rhizobium sp. C1 TaxID=1349799 RepID=UPI001E2CC5BC|nr:ABC transporter permease [Rhizobium sp. C1]MCD2177963.1 ABC transporter permease [Rhizobium sp. C1]
MIRFILADLNRFRLGAFFIAAIVALAVALGVAVTLQERALRLGSARAAEKFDLIVGAAGSETQLVLSSVFLQPSALPLMTGKVLSDLEADPRVAWAAPIGFGDFFGTSPIVGTTTTLVKNLSAGVSEGAIFAREGEAVIGADVKLPMGSTVKPMHGTLGEGGHTHTELAYTVVGRLKPTGSAWDKAILVPIRAVWDIHGLGHHHDDGDADEHDHDHAAAGADAAKPADAKEPAGHDDHDGHDEHEHHAIDPNQAINEQWQGELPDLPAVVVKPKSIADAYKLRQQYRKDATLAVFPGEVLTTLYATLGDVKQVLSAVAAGAQLLVGAALILVIVMHIGQRRKQIGALRAFGAPREAVFGIVWLELFGLVATGIMAGLVLGYLAARVIAARLAADSGFHMPVGFAPEDMTSISILLIASALLCALPAIIAYRQPPASALRG